MAGCPLVERDWKGIGRGRWTLGAAGLAVPFLPEKRNDRLGECGAQASAEKRRSSAGTKAAWAVLLSGLLSLAVVCGSAGFLVCCTVHSAALHCAIVCNPSLARGPVRETTPSRSAGVRQRNCDLPEQWPRPEHLQLPRLLRAEAEEHTKPPARPRSPREGRKRRCDPRTLALNFTACSPQSKRTPPPTHRSLAHRINLPHAAPIVPSLHLDVYVRSFLGGSTGRRSEPTLVTGHVWPHPSRRASVDVGPSTATLSRANVQIHREATSRLRRYTAIA